MYVQGGVKVQWGVAHLLVKEFVSRPNFNQHVDLCSRHPPKERDSEIEKARVAARAFPHGKRVQQGQQPKVHADCIWLLCQHDLAIAVIIEVHFARFTKMPQRLEFVQGSFGILVVQLDSDQAGADHAHIRVVKLAVAVQRARDGGVAWFRVVALAVILAVEECVLGIAGGGAFSRI